MTAITDRRLPKFATASLLAAAMAMPAAAAPQGAVVKRGNVTIEQIGSEYRVTASDGSIVEYSAFDVANGELVNFLSQSGLSGARILNRVTTLDRAVINGAIGGNMIVYLSVPGGITFGPNAQVVLPGFAAVAGSISDADFIEGVDRFTGLSSSIEIQQGAELNATDSLALIANRVFNAGEVRVDDGTLIIAVGDEVLFTTLNDHVMVRVTGNGATSYQGDTAGLTNTSTGEITADRGRLVMAVGDPLGAASAEYVYEGDGYGYGYGGSDFASGLLDNEGIIGSLGDTEITATSVQGSGLFAGRNLSIITTQGIGDGDGVEFSSEYPRLIAGNLTLEVRGEGGIDVDLTTFDAAGFINDENFEAPEDFGFGNTTLDRVSALGDVLITGNGSIVVDGLVEGSNVTFGAADSLTVLGTVQAFNDIDIDLDFGAGTITTQAGARIESITGDITIAALDLMLDTSSTGTVEGNNIFVDYTGGGVMGLGTSETGDFAVSAAEFQQFLADRIEFAGDGDQGIVLGTLNANGLDTLGLTTSGGVSEEVVDFNNNITGVTNLNILAGGDVGMVPPGSTSTADRGTVDTMPTGDLATLIDFDVENLDIFVTQPGTVNVNDTAGDLYVTRIFTTSGDIRIEAVGDLTLFDVTANSEVTAGSASGNLGLGTVSASEGITLNASAGSITDVRPAGTTTPNLTAGTNVFLAANSVGSEAAPVTWDGGMASVNSASTNGFVSGASGTTVTPAGVTTTIMGPSTGGETAGSTTPADIAADIPRGNAARGDLDVDANAPLWVVGDFLETVGWLAPHPQLAQTERQWGAELADLVEVLLQQRGKRTAGLGDEEVSEAEVQELVQQGLEYKLDGVIESLEAYVDDNGEPMARLTVVYQLEKNIAQQLRVVQKRRLRTTNDAEPVITEQDLNVLMDMTAQRIVERVVEETPAGMMGVRG